MLKIFGGIILIISIGITLFYQQYVLNSIHFQPIDLTNTVALVTGGSSGIGLETVRKLIEWNATVIMPVRNIKKGEDVKNEILSTLPKSSVGQIELMEMDLASFTSVRQFASKLNDRNIHLDIVILNAVRFSFISSSNLVRVCKVTLKPPLSLKME